jgi:predicted class III extradiol MEMO1 family dioxygenase
MIATRPPAVAGMFYPGDPDVLSTTVDQLLADSAGTADSQPKALIVPHAGYVYSGSTAAAAYAALAPWAETIHRVILLGPTHRVAVDGIALPEAEAFATPLGTIRLDAQAITVIADLPQIVFSDHVHAFEHSLAVGQASPEAVAEVLDKLWDGPETLIVVSSDLSHFLPYGTAQQVDSNTCRHILQLDTHLNPEQACGAFPINGLLLAARRRGLKPELLGLCNSGDTAGDKSRVVGYAAFAFTEGEHHA